MDAVAVGLGERTILEKSKGGYKSKMCIILKILNEISCLREEALVLDAEGKAVPYSVEKVPITDKVLLKAQRIFQLQLPITVTTAKRLFAAISIDTSLPRKRIRGPGADADDGNENANLEVEGVNPNKEINPANPAANKITSRH